MNVVLISRDHRLGAILTMALSAPEQLTVLGSPAEVPESFEVEIDAVVLDLPADSRRDAYDELRQRYEGRVVVPVDNARDTSGWPPDAKRRFLVRPFQVADLIAGVQEPKETSVSERAAQYRRRFRWNRHQVPVFPTLTGTPSGTGEPAEAQAAAEEAYGDGELVAASDERAPEELADSEADQGPATVEYVIEPEEEPESAAADRAGAEDDSREPEEQLAARDGDQEQDSGEAGDGADETVATAEDEEPLTADEDEQAAAEAGDAAEAATTEDQDEEPPTAAQDDEAPAEAEDDDAVAEAEDDEAVIEAEAEDHEATVAETGDDEALAKAEDDEALAEAEDDEAVIGELEELVLADAGMGEVEELRPDSAERPPESPEEDRDADAMPPAPPLQVQASVAMAEAVALQQWLETEETRRLRKRRRLVVANIAAGLVLLLAGIGIGRAVVPEQPQQTTPPPTPRQKVQIRDAPPPAACTAAMDNADQVISYLVAKIRDERLAKSIQAYGANARACRNTGR